MNKKGYIMLLNEKGETIEMTKNYQIPPDAYDYIIYKEGDHVLAKNGKSGKIEFRDEEPNVVLQDIFDTSGGDVSIFIKPGEYVFKESVLFAKNGGMSIEILGAGRATILRGDDIDAIFTSKDESGYVYNPGGLLMHDLTVKDAKAYHGSAYYSHFYRLIIDNPNGDGIYLTDTSDPAGNCVDNQIYGNYMYAVTGIYIGVRATDNIIARNIINCSRGGQGIIVDNAYGQQIVDNHIYNVKNSCYGIYISRTRRFIIEGNKVELSGDNYCYGIGVYGKLGVKAGDGIIKGNRIEGNNATGTRGIRIFEDDVANAPDLINIVGNIITGTLEYGIQAPNATDILIDGNIIKGTITTAIDALNATIGDNIT